VVDKKLRLSWQVERQRALLVFVSTENFLWGNTEPVPWYLREKSWNKKLPTSSGSILLQDFALSPTDLAEQQ
jgi:hypothetical protein